MSRRGRTSRHHDTEATTPRVPIIPMLDMAFQLLAFGLTLFDLSPQMEEGQYTMSLPDSGEGMVAPTDPTKLDDKPPEKFILTVVSDSTGRVRTIEVSRDQSAKESLPRELKPLTEELKTQRKASIDRGGKEPTVEIQFDPELNYQVAFDLFAAVNDAELKKVTPNILAPPAKPGEPKPGDPMPPTP
jgi:biopolymer transport protein ExbD